MPEKRKNKLPKGFIAVVKRIRGEEPEAEDLEKEIWVESFLPSEVTEKAPNSDSEKRRVDPDPVSVFLAALGALGSFASLAAYRDWRRQKERERRRARRTVMRAISASREALEDIDSALSRLERLLERNAKGDGRNHLEAPVEFGSINAFFDFFEFSAYQMLAQRVTHAFDTTIRETAEIMDALEDGAIEAPRDLFLELRELQSRLEDLRQSKRSFGDTIAATRSLTQRMIGIADELEKHISFDRVG